MLDPHAGNDPWGSGYRIRCTGDDVHVTSAGADGQLGTPDDIRDAMKPENLPRGSDVPIAAYLAFIASLASVVVFMVAWQPTFRVLRRFLGPNRVLPDGALGAGPWFLYLPAVASVATVLLGPPYAIAAAAGSIIAAASALFLLAGRLVLRAMLTNRRVFHIERGAARRRTWRRRESEPLRVIGTVVGAEYECTGVASGFCIFRLELLLADGSSLRNAYVDEATRDRDRAQLAIPSSYRVAAPHDSDEPPSRVGDRQDQLSFAARP